MSQLDFLGRIDATELTPGVFVVAAHGPMDERVAGELRDLLVPVAAADGAVIVLDLADAHGLDTAALEVVGTAAHLVRRRGERLAIITTSENVLERVRESGLDEVVTVCASLREAIGE